jgi:chemotaxis protein methyltransferase CheR
MKVIEPYQLHSLMQSINSVYGYDFTNYAEASLLRRSIRYMQIHGISTAEELTKILLTNEDMFENYIQTLSITVTEMFRDPSFFRHLREKIIPRLNTYPFIKVWVAGCATGEEAYSLAIVLKEEGLLDRTIIYATDINQRSLNTAREGIFPMELINAYTTNYVAAGGKSIFSDYYTAKLDCGLVRKELKNNIVFAAHNLATDQSFNEFQLILCRNVLIYFNDRLQNKVIDLFYDSLCPFGFLGLGSKESLLFSDTKNNFAKLDPSEKLFVRVN